MLTPEGLKRWAKSRLLDFIDAWFDGTQLFPWEVQRFGRADKNDVASRIDDDVRQLVEGSAEVLSDSLPATTRPRRGLGYSVRMEVRRMRNHGEQPLPQRVWFETKEDYLAFVGLTERWREFLADIDAAANAAPRFAEWLRKNPRAVWSRLSAGSGLAFGMALDALDKNPRPNCFAREIALPGISGKFIEESLDFIADVLRQSGSEAWREGADCHEQLALRKTSRLLRLMALDGNRLDFGLPQDRFLTLPNGCHSVLVVENLRTFLCLPALPGVLAIYGEGRAAQTLVNVPLLATVPFLYWGDIDPNGFGILDALRAQYPQVRSIMMDEKTLHENASLTSPASRLTSSSFGRLTKPERAAADIVQANGAGVEQEKIPPAVARALLESVTKELLVSTAEGKSTSTVEPAVSPLAAETLQRV